MKEWVQQVILYKKYYFVSKTNTSLTTIAYILQNKDLV